MDLTTYRSRSFKRLLIKVAQAKEELEEVKVVYQNAEHILTSGINVFCKKNNIKNPLYELSKEKVKKEKIAASIVFNLTKHKNLYLLFICFMIPSQN